MFEMLTADYIINLKHFSVFSREYITFMIPETNNIIYVILIMKSYGIKVILKVNTVHALCKSTLYSLYQSE